MIKSELTILLGDINCMLKFMHVLCGIGALFVNELLFFMSRYSDLEYFYITVELFFYF